FHFERNFIATWRIPPWLASGWECLDRHLSTALRNPGTPREPLPNRPARHKRGQGQDARGLRAGNSTRPSDSQEASETPLLLLFPAAAPDTFAPVRTQDTWLGEALVQHRVRKKHFATRAVLQWGFCVRVRPTREHMAAQASGAVCPRGIVCSIRPQ